MIKTIHFHRLPVTILALLLAFQAGCAGFEPPEQQATSLPSLTTAPSATPTPTTPPTATSTHTPTASPTPAPTQTPTETLTPTPDQPHVIAAMRAFCRYGPGKAYLYSHELKEGDQALVDGRNGSSTWLWVQPANLDRHCWVSASVVQLFGELSTVNVVQTRLPQSTLYGPPEDVDAVRDGDEVTVTWNRVWMTEDDDRGYLIEALVCQNGALIFVAVQTNDTSYVFTDERNCSQASGGRLYTVEKHGYTTPVEIPWP